MKFSIFFLPVAGWVMVLYGAPPVLAQTEPVWTLPASVQRALANAPEMRAAEAEIAARSGDLSQADAWPNPTIELRADEKKVIETQNRRGGLNLNQITLTQPIPLRRLAHQRRAAEENMESARAERQTQRLQIETRTAQAYHALQLAAERQNLAKERLAFAEELQGDSKRKKF